MGFWSGVWNGIKSIANSLSTMLKESPLVSKLVTAMAALLPPPIDVVAVLLIQVVAASEGIDENPDELGWQMNEADKKPEDFGSFKEYKEYLDEKYPFEREKFEEMPDEKKMACRYAGMAGMMLELQEFKNFELTPETLGILAGSAAKLKWNDGQINAFAKGLIQYLSASGVASLSDVEALSKGSLSADKWEAVDGAILAGARAAGVKQENPEIIASLQENA